MAAAQELHNLMTVDIICWIDGRIHGGRRLASEIGWRSAGSLLSVA